MLRAKQITKIYRVNKTVVKVLDAVDLEVKKGEFFSLIGMSGSGKSTLARILLGLIEPTEGEVFFLGQKKKGLLPQKIQMVFQDPFSSLNPRMKIKQILSEPTYIHKLPNRVEELLELVGLAPSTKEKYPHELSGGQKQRIGIARALALQPELLLCDEAVSSLDVSIQAQIMQLLLQLQKELNLTILFISHDLRLVQNVSDRIAVIHQGKIIETAECDAMFSSPNHPFTKQLIHLNDCFHLLDKQPALFPK